LLCWQKPTHYPAFHRRISRDLKSKFQVAEYASIYLKNKPID
jgi:hypothetical protein